MKDKNEITVRHWNSPDSAMANSHSNWL